MIRTLFCFFFICAAASSYGQQSADVRKDSASDTGNVYAYTEKQPEFRGNIYQYLAKHVHYPEAAIQARVQGKVYVRFIVQEDGAITDVEVIKGISPECDAVAAKAVRDMPRWKPAEREGKPVACTFTQPVVFRLE